MGAASLMGLPHAEASVSLTVLLDELVRESSGAAVVSPIEHHAVWEDDRIVTYTRVRVERVVAGSIAEPVWVRTLGGEVGDIGQIVEGEAQLAAGQSSLFFLRPHLDPVTRRPTGAFAVAEGAQGQFPVVAPAGGKAHLELARDLGALYPPSEAQRKRSPTAPIARDALCNRPLEAALRAIVEAWRRIRGG
jgi:hypothetical protein